MTISQHDLGIKQKESDSYLSRTTDKTEQRFLVAIFGLKKYLRSDLRLSDFLGGGVGGMPTVRMHTVIPHTTSGVPLTH